MKKLLTIIVLLTFLQIPTFNTYAQEETNENTVEEDIQKENTEEQKVETLSENFEEKEVEDIQPPSTSFLTILGAILIPSIFIILCYLVLKFFKT